MIIKKEEKKYFCNVINEILRSLIRFHGKERLAEIPESLTEICLQVLFDGYEDKEKNVLFLEFMKILRISLHLLLLF